MSGIVISPLEQPAWPRAFSFCVGSHGAVSGGDGLGVAGVRADHLADILAHGRAGITTLE